MTPKRSSSLTALAVGTAACVILCCVVAHCQDSASPGGTSPGRSLGDPTARKNWLERQAGELAESILVTRGRVPPISDRLDDIQGRISKIKPPKPEEEPPPEEIKKVRLVKVRPPQKGEVIGKFKLFVCVDRRVCVADYDAIQNAYVEQVEKQVVADLSTAPVGKKWEGTATVESGDFELKYSLIKNLGGASGGFEGKTGGLPPAFKFVQKAGKRGESVEQIREANSRFQRELAGLDPKKTTILFAVYPDSAETLRAARELAWKQELRVNALFIPAGKVMKFDPGEIPSDSVVLDP